MFKKSKRLIPLFMAAMMLTTAIGASAQELPKDPDWESKIDQELKAAMEKADKGEKIPVAVWLRDETVLETEDRRLKERTWTPRCLKIRKNSRQRSWIR